MARRRTVVTVVQVSTVSRNCRVQCHALSHRSEGRRRAHALVQLTATVGQVVHLLLRRQPWASTGVKKLRSFLSFMGRGRRPARSLLAAGRARRHWSFLDGDARFSAGPRLSTESPPVGRPVREMARLTPQAPGRPAGLNQPRLRPTTSFLPILEILPAPGPGDVVPVLWPGVREGDVLAGVGFVCLWSHGVKAGV